MALNLRKNYLIGVVVLLFASVFVRNSLVRADLGVTPATGYIDGTTDASIYGWAYDPDLPSQISQIHVYEDGPAGVGVDLGTANTGIPRPDVDSYFGITGDHGFVFSIPQAFRDGAQHLYYVYAVDLNDPTQQTLFQNAPIPATRLGALPLGYLETENEGSIYGWTLDPDLSSQSNSVEIYIDGPSGTGTSIGTTTANIPRPDVNDYYATTGDHGFVFPVPTKYRDGLSHSYYVYGIDIDAPTQEQQLSSSPQSFTIAPDNSSSSSIPAGSLAFPDYGDGTITFRSRTDGSLLATEPATDQTIYSQSVDALDSGIFSTNVSSNGSMSTDIFKPDLSLIATVPVINGARFGGRGDYNHTFFIPSVRYDQGANQYFTDITPISDTGVAGQVWTVPTGLGEFNDFLSVAIAVAPDDSVIYYSGYERNLTGLGYDTIYSSPFGDSGSVFATQPGSTIAGMFVMRNGDVLVGWLSPQGSQPPTTLTVIRYNPAGQAVETYPVSSIQNTGYQYGTFGIASDNVDDSSFWVEFNPQGSANTTAAVRLDTATGTVLNNLTFPTPVGGYSGEFFLTRSVSGTQPTPPPAPTPTPTPTPTPSPTPTPTPVSTPTPPPSLTLNYLGLTRDLVTPGESSSSPDGQKDTEIGVTLSDPRTVTSLTLKSDIGTWDTIPGDGYWFLGVAPDSTSPLVNSFDQDLNFTGSIFNIYASDDSTPQYLTPGNHLTVTATFSDGSTSSGALTVPPPPLKVKDGQLYRQNGVIYVISDGQKRAFASLTTFLLMNYKTSNIIDADVSAVPNGPGILTPDQRHPRGTLLFEINQSAPTEGLGGKPYGFYFLGETQQYQFPSKTMFDCWGNAQSDVVTANVYDLGVPMGPTVEAPTDGCSTIVNYDDLIDEISQTGDLQKAVDAGLIVTQADGTDEDSIEIDIIHPQTKEVLLSFYMESDIASPPTKQQMACIIPGTGGNSSIQMTNGKVAKLKPGVNKIYIDPGRMSGNTYIRVDDMIYAAKTQFEAALNAAVSDKNIPSDNKIPTLELVGSTADQPDITIVMGTPAIFAKNPNIIMGMDANTRDTYKKTIYINPNALSKYDATPLGNIMAHELMHAFGLGHSTDPNSLMWPYANLNKSKNIDINNILALNVIYSDQVTQTPLSSCKLLISVNNEVPTPQPDKTQLPDMTIPDPSTPEGGDNNTPVFTSGYCGGGYDAATNTCVDYIQYDDSSTDNQDPCANIDEGNNWALCWEENENQ